MAGKVEFLHRYVTFRRNYDELDFHIRYVDGGSFPPAPSQSDVRLIARVPPGELDQWMSVTVQPVAKRDVSWIADIPNPEKAAGITEWYVEARRVVGIDRQRSIVAYRVWRY